VLYRIGKSTARLEATLRDMISSLIQPDDLVTRKIDTVLFEATTGCNLRCTYCGVSSPTYISKDFDFGRIEEIAASMAAVHVRTVQISGHGETTMLPDWVRYCREFLDRKIGLCITSNFSKIFSDDEIDVLARMDWITVSIDTVNRKLLMEIRRRVDLRTILYNMQAVRLRALTKYGRLPVFNWQCTLSNLVIDGLVDWAQMGILSGVEQFTLGNLIENQEVARAVSADGLPVPRHIARLERDELLEACRTIQKTVHAVREGGAAITIQPGIEEGIAARLASFGMNAPLNLLEQAA